MLRLEAIGVISPQDEMLIEAIISMHLKDFNPILVFYKAEIKGSARPYIRISAKDIRMAEKIAKPFENLFDVEIIIPAKIILKKITKGPRCKII